MECETHKLPFFDALKEHMPAEHRGLVGPDLFTKFIDPVKAAEYALQAVGVALVFGIVWHLLAERYQLGITLYRAEEEAAEVPPAGSSS